MTDGSRPTHRKAAALGSGDREALGNVATGLRRLYQVPTDDLFADLLNAIECRPRQRQRRRIFSWR